MLSFSLFFLNQAQLKHTCNTGKIAASNQTRPWLWGLPAREGALGEAILPRGRGKGLQRAGLRAAREVAPCDDKMGLALVWWRPAFVPSYAVGFAGFGSYLMDVAHLLSRR